MANPVRPVLRRALESSQVGARRPFTENVMGRESLQILQGRMNGSRRSYTDDHANAARFKRTRNHVFKDFDDLTLRNLSLNIHAKTTIDISLCRGHLPLLPLVLADHFSLIGNDNFRVHHNRKI